MENVLIINKKFPELIGTNFIEEVNVTLAKKFLNARWRKHNDLELDIKNIGYLKKYLATFGSNNNTIVEYAYSKKLQDTGRIYPKKHGLELIPKLIRNAIVENIYKDLDIKNAHPTFDYNLAKKYELDLPCLKLYVLEREAVIGELKKELKKEKSDIKEIVCSIINGSLNFYNNVFLNTLSTEIITLYEAVSVDYPHLLQIAKKINVIGSFMSILNQSIEQNIMRIIVFFLKSKDVEVCSLIHDGCLIKPFENVEEILKECNQFIKENYYNFEIELVVKPFDLHNFTDPDNEELKVTELKLSQLFIEFSKQNNNNYIYHEQHWYYSNVDTNVLWKENNIQYLHEQLTGEPFIQFCLDSLEVGQKYDFRSKIGSVQGSKNIIHFLTIHFLKHKTFGFNQNKSLLSFKNGVMDLDTNVFREHKSEDYLTIFIDRDFIKVNHFEKTQKFMYSLFECHDTKDYVLKILATCIIGIRKFEEFFVFSGVGSNGKSTLFDITKAAIGPYASEISPNFFCEKPSSSACPQPEIHESRFSRGLFMAEPEENSTFNSSKIKMFTAKSIKTRTIFETPVEWAILFTIIFGCNNLPKFDDTTPAFKRRVRIINFPFSFKEKEDIKNINHREKVYFQFDDSFYNEFINLLIDYYQRFIHECKNNNLVPIPKKVQEYTQCYFDDNDRLGAAVKELFTITSDIEDRLTRKEVYDHYSNGVEEVKYRVGQKKLYDYLRTNLDLQERKNDSSRYFFGIKLNIKPNEFDVIDDEL